MNESRRAKYKKEVIGWWNCRSADYQFVVISKAFMVARKQRNKGDIRIEQEADDGKLD